MEKLTKLILMLACGHVTYLHAAVDDQCSLLKPSDVKLSLKVYRNITGHWITRAILNNGPARNQPVNEQLDLWDMDIAQTTVPCESGDAVAIEVTLSSPPRRASPGYELFPGVGYYKLHTTKLNWEQARAKCIEEGSHLVIINSEAEANVLKQLLAQTNGWVLVGFHDRYTEGQYVTVLGTPLNSTGYTHWSSPTEPNNEGGNEDCGTVHPKGGLNDYSCSYPAPFVCEQEI